MPQCQSLFSAIFVFQKSYTGNILGIGQNKSRTSYFYRSFTKTEDETEGARSQAHHRGARPSPWPCRPMVRPAGPTSNDALSPIKSLPKGNPKTIGDFRERVLQLRRRHRQISGDRNLCSGTLPRQGSALGAISIGLHRRLHRLHRPHHHLHRRCCLR
jgi:hypothetical protein